jgi:GNAT superfamily N-acetyltransferase
MNLKPYEVQHDEFTISTDPARLDVDVIYDYLANQSYWAQGRSKARNQRMMDACLCFGVYKGDEQVGYARVLTDYGLLGYIADVFVLEPFRGKGLGKALIRAILDHPDLHDVSQWLLKSSYAHGLYSQFGFEPLAAPEVVMSIGFASGAYVKTDE